MPTTPIMTAETETIPESEETKNALNELRDALNLEVGTPNTVTRAIAALVDAKIADAVEYAADRVAKALGAQAADTITATNIDPGFTP